MTFSDRFGYDPGYPSRTRLEDDSSELRMTIWNLASREGRAPLQGYRALCQHLNRLPDPDIWGDDRARQEGLSILQNLYWARSYEILESLYRDRPQERTSIQHAANTALAQSGLGYEMRNGLFEILDEVADALEVRHNEDEALAVLAGPFAAVRAQYLRSLEALRGTEPNFETALGESLGSLEAVAKVITGDEHATLPDVLPRLFPDGMDYHRILKAGMNRLYAYASDVPGARHGRYAEPDIVYKETAMVVRIVGAMIVFLVAAH
jgi:hypothetical protein